MLDYIFRQYKQLSFRPKQQQYLLEDLADLVSDGVSLRQAVAIIANTATNITKEVAEDVLTAFSKGEYLAQGLSKWLPDSVIEIIRAGEEGGTLEESLRAAAAALTKRNNVLSVLITSLTYPLVVLFAGCAVAVFINHSIFNNFRSILPMSKWPEVGQNLVAFANVIQHWWIAFIFMTVGMIFTIAYLLKNYVGDFRLQLDKLPGIDLYRKQNAGRFMHSLGLLMENGVILKRAIKILQTSANPYLSWHLFSVEHRLSLGQENIADVLDTGLIDKTDLMRLKIISHGRSFEHALKRQGARSLRQNELAIQRSARIAGGLLLISGALLAIFMILGIYNVGSVIGSY